ncbi:MAG: LCP family protein [Eubacterium sp.]|nr:LCP family protein [Eubacterium sp.]
MKKFSILIYICIVLVVIGGSGLGTVHYLFGGLEKDNSFRDALDRLETDYSSASQDSDVLNNANITNIAIFGVDTESGDSGRSDATMIISLDNEHDKIKMSSIARDSLVHIPQRDTYEKFTHAYAYGGASLSVATLNENFNTNIKDYISVNFSEMASIIDLVGGVEIDMSAEELNHISRYTKDLSGLEVGKITVNGEQAVAYSRIRYIDSDYARNGRQREVLNSLFEKAKKMKKTEYPAFIKQCMSLCTTSLDYKELVSMSSILTKKNVELEQFSVPLETTCDVWGGIQASSGAWVYIYNTRRASGDLLEFIYEDIYDNANITLPEATVTRDCVQPGDKQS